MPKILKYLQYPNHYTNNLSQNRMPHQQVNSSTVKIFHSPIHFTEKLEPFNERGSNILKLLPNIRLRMSKNQFFKHALSKFEYVGSS